MPQLLDLRDMEGQSTLARVVGAATHLYARILFVVPPRLCGWRARMATPAFALRGSALDGWTTGLPEDLFKDLRCPEMLSSSRAYVERVC